VSRRRDAQFEAHIARLKNRRLGVVTPPAKAGLGRTIADAAAKLRTSGDIAPTM